MCETIFDIDVTRVCFLS